MGEMSKKNLQKLRKRFDPILREIMSATIRRKAETLNFYENNNEIRVKIKPKKCREILFQKYPASTHSGLLRRVLYMANLPLRKPEKTKAGMIQVCLAVSKGNKFIAFYVEDKSDKSRHKREIMLAPIWISFRAC